MNKPAVGPAARSQSLESTCVTGVFGVKPLSFSCNELEREWRPRQAWYLRGSGTGGHRAQ